LGRAAVATLTSMMRQQHSWKAANGAYGLARLGHAEGFEQLEARLSGSSDSAYPMATLLAKGGSDALRALSARFGQAARAAHLAQLVRAALADHRPRNCYEQRYTHWLAACFDGGCDQDKGLHSLDEACDPA
jgi:hypothetical protein